MTPPPKRPFTCSNKCHHQPCTEWDGSGVCVICSIDDFVRDNPERPCQICRKDRFESEFPAFSDICLWCAYFGDWPAQPMSPSQAQNAAPPATRPSSAAHAQHAAPSRSRPPAATRTKRPAPSSPPRPAAAWSKRPAPPSSRPASASFVWPTTLSPSQPQFPSHAENAAPSIARPSSAAPSISRPDSTLLARRTALSTPQPSVPQPQQAAPSIVGTPPASRAMPTPAASVTQPPNAPSQAGHPGPYALPPFSSGVSYPEPYAQPSPASSAAINTSPSTARSPTAHRAVRRQTAPATQPPITVPQAVYPELHALPPSLSPAMHMVSSTPSQPSSSSHVTYAASYVQQGYAPRGTNTAPYAQPPYLSNPPDPSYSKFSNSNS
ncbi:hypothetical protein DL765_010343 [Monosporascus sp. GIB2]|nr:hypothetical protein DL765_010343 [Monosporascus sp. GIB2]